MSAYSHALGVVFQNLPERDVYKGTYDEAKAIVLALLQNGLMHVAVEFEDESDTVRSGGDA